MNAADRPIVTTSELIRETSEAYWFRCVLANGRTITMTVPKAVAADVAQAEIRAREGLMRAAQDWFRQPKDRRRVPRPDRHIRGRADRRRGTSEQARADALADALRALPGLRGES